MTVFGNKPAPAPPPPAWRYLVRRCDYPETTLAKELAEAGAAGWELVSVNECRDLVAFRAPAGWLLVFKKPGGA